MAIQSLKKVNKGLYVMFEQTPPSNLRKVGDHVCVLHPDPDRVVQQISEFIEVVHPELVVVDSLEALQDVWSQLLRSYADDVTWLLLAQDRFGRLAPKEDKWVRRWIHLSSLAPYREDGEIVGQYINMAVTDKHDPLKTLTRKYLLEFGDRGLCVALDQIKLNLESGKMQRRGSSIFLDGIFYAKGVQDARNRYYKDLQPKP
jgi:hypothetical protein